jgi:hypothetical protein
LGAVSSAQRIALHRGDRPSVSPAPRSSESDGYLSRLASSEARAWLGFMSRTSDRPYKSPPGDNSLTMRDKRSDVRSASETKNHSKR